MNAIRIVEGDLRVGDLRIALVASRFNESIVERLVQGAVEALATPWCGSRLTRARARARRVRPAARRATASPSRGRFDAIVALGAVIRGETPHFDYVAGECAAGLARVA